MPITRSQSREHPGEHQSLQSGISKSTLNSRETTLRTERLSTPKHSNTSSKSDDIPLSEEEKADVGSGKYKFSEEQVRKLSAYLLDAIFDSTSTVPSAPSQASSQITSNGPPEDTKILDFASSMRFLYNDTFVPAVQRIMPNQDYQTITRKFVTDIVYRAVKEFGPYVFWGTPQQIEILIYNIRLGAMTTLGAWEMVDRIIKSPTDLDTQASESLELHLKFKYIFEGGDKFPVYIPSLMREEVEKWLDTLE